MLARKNSLKQHQQETDPSIYLAIPNNTITNNHFRAITNNSYLCLIVKKIIVQFGNLLLFLKKKFPL